MILQIAFGIVVAVLILTVLPYIIFFAISCIIAIFNEIFGD